MILGGVTAGGFGPEVLLGTKVFRWVGKLSFSLYLWHWPVLTVGTQEAGHALSLGDRLLLVGLSVIGATLTFYLFENRSVTLRGSPSISYFRHGDGMG